MRRPLVLMLVLLAGAFLALQVRFSHHAPPRSERNQPRPAVRALESLPGGSADLQNLKVLENRVIEHFYSDPLEPAEKAALCRDLEEMAARARDLQTEPSRSFCLLLRDLLQVKALAEIDSLQADSWHKANLRYLLEYPGGAATALVLLQRGRTESMDFLDLTLDHIANDYGPDRGEQLVADHARLMDLEKELDGKDVVDIGGARGAFAAALVGYVGPRGSLTVVDLHPGFARLIAQTAAYDKRFARVGFRLGQLDDTRLPEASVDVAFINEVHQVGNVADPGYYQQTVLPWVRSVRRALRHGGRIVVLEAHPQLSTYEQAAACLREAGFGRNRTVAIPATEPGMAPGYVMSALRPDHP